jgi:hypothetical protein
VRSAFWRSACGLGLAVAGIHPAAAEPSVCEALSACVLYGVGEIPGTARDGLTLVPPVLEDGTPNNQVGALGSAIAYTGADDLYVAMPDRGPKDGATSFASRFYVIRLSLDGGKVTPALVRATPLRQPSGATHSGLKYLFDAENGPGGLRFDPEGVRVSPRGTLYVSEEYGPTLGEFSADGKRLRTLRLPDKLLIANPDVENAELPPRNRSGRQANRSMEGLAISPDGSKLYGAMQSPLIQDGALDASNVRIGTNTRVVEVDTRSGRSREFLYPLESPKHGISEILAVSSTQFLVLERDSLPGLTAVFKRLFLIDVTRATDISGLASLPTTGFPAGVAPVSKRPFLDLLHPAYGLSGATFPEKLEGLAFGPDRPDGKHVLVVTSDNDGAATAPNRFYVFLVDPRALPAFARQRATFSPPRITPSALP